MRRIVPGKTNAKLPVFAHFTISDIIYLLAGLCVLILVMILMMLAGANPFAILGVILGLIAILIIFAAKVGEFRLYYYMRHVFMFWFRNKIHQKQTLTNAIGITVKDGFVKNTSGTYSKIIRVSGINFDLINEEAQDNKINQLSMVMSSINKGKIIKLDMPIRFIDNAKEAAKRIENLTAMYEKITDKSSIEAIQLESRIKASSIDLEIYASLDEGKSILSECYYLILLQKILENFHLFGLF